MKAGERVDLIKEIADRMSGGSDFNKIEADLVFSEFGFAYADWTGNPHTYALGKAATGSDDQIAELARYLDPPEDVEGDGQQSNEAIIESLNPWQGKGFKLFCLTVLLTPKWQENSVITWLTVGSKCSWRTKASKSPRNGKK